MKGYQNCVVIFLALCTAVFVTACAENSGWGTSFGGEQIQQGGVNTGEAPPGSGTVPYIHEGPL